MPFSESIKQEARIKAHYRCCICEQIAPLEVHHIVPQEECNDNSFDNAVALCANCHNTYGDSRQHRKWIKEKRDWWYAHCEKEPVFMEKVEELYEIVVDSKNTNEAKFGRIESLIQGLATIESANHFTAWFFSAGAENKGNTSCRKRSIYHINCSKCNGTASRQNVY